MRARVCVCALQKPADDSMQSAVDVAVESTHAASTPAVSIHSNEHMVHIMLMTVSSVLAITLNDIQTICSDFAVH